MRLLKSVAFTFVILSFCLPVLSQNSIWNGNVNSDWGNPGNWNNGVPTINTVVAINPSLNNPIIAIPNAFAAKITIKNGATLTIDLTRNLTVDGQMTGPQPLINIESGGEIFNKGELYLTGSIGIGINILSGGSFFNENTGIVEIDSVENDAIRNSEDFDNYGRILIDNEISSLNSLPSGPHGILNSSGGRFNNFGFISIINGSATNGSSIRNSGRFFNSSCSSIIIDGLLRNAAGASGPFTNEGLIQSSFTGINVNNNAQGFINNGILANITATHATSTSFFGGNNVSGSNDYRINSNIDGFCIDAASSVFILDPCNCSDPLNNFDPDNLENSLFHDSIIIDQVPNGIFPFAIELGADNSIDNFGNPSYVPYPGFPIGANKYVFKIFRNPDTELDVKIIVGGQIIEVSSEACVLDKSCLAAQGIGIPTLGQWGIILLGLLTTIFGLLYLKPNGKLIPVRIRNQKK